MGRLIRTTSENKDFISLVALLDADLAQRDGDEHSFYAQFNSIARLQHVVVVYENDTPAGCGAIKPYDEHSVEVKRMYVAPEFRGKGIAGQVLAELEAWAGELGFSGCVLETGRRQPEAIALYTKHGYQKIPNYGQYKGVENSVCFEKILSR